MITPLYPLTYSCQDITFAAYFETFRVPITLIFRTFYIFSDDTTPLEKIVVPAAIMPAQFTTTWIFLQFSTVKLMSCCTFFSSATLVLKNKHPSFLAIQVPCSSLRSAMTTCTFWFLNSSTVASPKPDAPPVTIATKDLSSLIIYYKWKMKTKVYIKLLTVIPCLLQFEVCLINFVLSFSIQIPWPENSSYSLNSLVVQTHLCFGYERKRNLFSFRFSNSLCMYSPLSFGASPSISCKEHLLTIFQAPIFIIIASLNRAQFFPFRRSHTLKPLNICYFFITVIFDWPSWLHFPIPIFLLFLLNTQSQIRSLPLQKIFILLKCSYCIFPHQSCLRGFSTCNLADFDNLSDLFDCFYDLFSNLSLNDPLSFVLLFKEPCLRKYSQFERYFIRCKMVLPHMADCHYSLLYVSWTQGTGKHFASGLALNRCCSFFTFEILESLRAFYPNIDFYKQNHYFSIILLYFEFYQMMACSMAQGGAFLTISAHLLTHVIYFQSFLFFFIVDSRINSSFFKCQ